MIKKETKKWQERWDVDNRGRKYHSVQKSINAQGVNRRNRKEELFVRSQSPVLSRVTEILELVLVSWATGEEIPEQMQEI